MSYETYKIFHILGILLVFMAVAGVITHVKNGGTKATNSAHKSIMMTHGLGMLLLLVSGFGSLAKLGIHGVPLWAGVKLAIWLVLGGIIPLVYRRPNLAGIFWKLVPVLGFIAGVSAIFKERLYS